MSRCISAAWSRISDMNFRVSEGEVVSLIGPNGAGKTTAFNVITGFLRPTEGEVRYRGASLNDLKPHEVAVARPGRAPSSAPACSRAISVFENVLIGLHRRGRSRLWDTLLALPRERESEARLEGAGRRNSGDWSASSAARTSWRARCPMASSACSAWRWRWRPSRRCCCSTSRCRA